MSDDQRFCGECGSLIIDGRECCPPVKSSNSSEKRTLFLARGRDAGYGYVWPEEIIDGPHSQPAGVARAADLHRRLFDDDSPFVMVETHNLSDGTSEGKDR